MFAKFSLPAAPFLVLTESAAPPLSLLLSLSQALAELFCACLLKGRPRKLSETRGITEAEEAADNLRHAYASAQLLRGHEAKGA